MIEIPFVNIRQDFEFFWAWPKKDEKNDSIFLRGKLNMGKGFVVSLPQPSPTKKNL